MVLEKPQDIAIIAGLFALFFIMISFGIDDINSFGAGVNNTQFSSVRNASLTQDGFKGVADSSIESITTVNSTGEAPTPDGIITQGFQGILGLGKTWGIMWSEMQNAIEFIGVPVEYVIILAGIIAISFFVVLYTWIRSRN